MIQERSAVFIVRLTSSGSTQLF